MAEVFQGTPCIVTVAISDPEGKKVEFNVCGREMDTVRDAVKAALLALPDEEQSAKPKPKRTRRTKAEMKTAEPVETREPVAAGAGKKETSWP